MLNFSKRDNDKQFISVRILDGASPSDLLSRLNGSFKGITKANVLADQEELLIEIPDDSGMPLGFSLNELKRFVNTFAKTIVNCFTVDFEEHNQRLYW